MAIEPLKIIKRWFRNNAVEPADLDEIANKTAAWSSRTDNNLKQIGLDINGDTYNFNNNGVRTQTNPIVGRLTTLESGASVGPRNLGIDVSTSTSTVTLTAADNTALSASNIGNVNINSSATAGIIVNRSITANVDILLTGTTWGFTVNLTDYPLWLLFIDDSVAGTAVFGIAAQGGQTSVTSAQTKTLPGDVTTIDKILAGAAITNTSNVTYWGRILCDFDYTGGASEKLWTIQTAVADVELQSTGTNFYGSYYF